MLTADDENDWNDSENIRCASRLEWENGWMRVGDFQKVFHHFAVIIFEAFTFPYRHQKKICMFSSILLEFERNVENQIIISLCHFRSCPKFNEISNPNIGSFCPITVRP